MKGLFWNIRGMGNPEKIGLLQDLIKENSVDFVGIMETIKQVFPADFLGRLGGYIPLSWEWIPAEGKSGGILVGINSEKLNILEVIKGRFCIKIKLEDINTKFLWDLLVVYGAAQHDMKAKFLAEFASFLQHQINPLMAGGDFNIIRKESEKNKAGGYNKWSFIFNAIVEQANLRELNLGGRQFTWCNNQESQTLEKLDRVFINNDMEKKFPLIAVKTLPRGLSDHNPLIVTTGEAVANQPIFKFEISWFLREDLNEVVKEVWNEQYSGSSIERWQKRFRELRKKLKGWNKNWEGLYRREKQEILSKIDEIDIRAETFGMSKDEREERRELETRLKFVIREEKTKWF